MSVRFNLKARDGTDIPVFEPPPPLSDFHKSAYDASLRRQYGIDSERRSADSFYNCHGMTFASRLGWMGIIERGVKNILIPGEVNEFIDSEAAENDIKSFLEANGYKCTHRISNKNVEKFTGEVDIKPGDIFIYKRFDFQAGKEFTEHSSVVIAIERQWGELQIIVLSKFGQGGEYFHSYLDLPEQSQYGNIVEIWSDRWGEL